VVDDTEQPDQRIVLVRHAETAWSLTGQHTGTTDLPLTPAGEAATVHLRERLHGRSFTDVLTSPLRRAAVTCRIAGFGDAAMTRDKLVEWDCITTLGWKRGVRVLEGWNERSHLPGAA
jgi:probable phosphoglycerate mutase